MLWSTRTRFVTVAIVSAGLGFVPIAATPEGQAPVDVSRNKGTVLELMLRGKPTFRGDKAGEVRIKWEWYRQVVVSYLSEKRVLTEDLSVGQQFFLRQEWVFAGMKTSFQDVFRLGPEHDDKLLPILAHWATLQLAPAESFVGLMLRGKQGEPKGPVTRVYMLPSVDGFYEVIEFKNARGEAEVARGLTLDAFTLRWQDIKNQVFDEVSPRRAAESRRMLREAYEKAFLESESNK